MKYLPTREQLWCIFFVVLAGAMAHQRDVARDEAAHYARLADDLDHAALLLGEPWSIMHGVGTIARDLNDGTARGWVGWLNNIDPSTSCLDGQGYIVCVAVKETCWEKP